MRRHCGHQFVSGAGRALAATLLTVLLACVSVSSCVTGASQAELPENGLIGVAATPVPLNPADPAVTAIGDFSYAGGIALTSSDTPLLHGLSDLTVTGSAHLTAIGDEGIVFDAQLSLSDGDRLTGLGDGRIAFLRGEDGRRLSSKQWADAEGMAQFANGDRIVSFERRHRILLYPADGGRPRAVASPRALFPPNAGMEAVAADPETAPDAYIVGAEDSGETWNCRLSRPTCVKRPPIPLPPDFGLVGMSELPGGRIAELLRAYDPRRGSRITLRVLAGTSEIARMDMASPMTVDNFEGLAAIPRADGRIRFYIISDDNGSATQRTLLMAFDWRPK